MKAMAINRQTTQAFDAYRDYYRDSFVDREAVFVASSVLTLADAARALGESIKSAFKERASEIPQSSQERSSPMPAIAITHQEHGALTIPLTSINVVRKATDGKAIVVLNNGNELQAKEPYKDVSERMISVNIWGSVTTEPA